MSAERIYNLIEEEQDQDSSKCEGENPDGTTPGGDDRKDADNPRGDGEPTAPTTPGGFGQVLDTPEPEGDDSDTVAEQTREWKIAVQQAENVAKLAGKLPAGITRSLEQAEAAGVDWRELLRRAWSETIPSDYCWMPPNRRHIWAGHYLPGVRSEGTGEIAIAIDCSGSINARQLGLFEAEIRSILEGQRPSLVHVLYFDTDVHKTEVY
jgi:predicted metal-dependent peptidase